MSLELVFVCPRTLGKLRSGPWENFWMGTKRMTGLSFWAKGYCISTVGLDAEMIKKYIKHQDK